MKEFLQLALDYMYLWAPSLMSVLSVAGLVLTGIVKLSSAADKLKDSEEFKQLKNQIKEERAENKLLREQLTKIEEKLNAFDSKCQAIIHGEEVIASYERADLTELKAACGNLNKLYSNMLKENTNVTADSETQNSLQDQ